MPGPRVHFPVGGDFTPRSEDVPDVRVPLDFCPRCGSEWDPAADRDTLCPGELIARATA